jgi:trans-aconitate methyltransferase
MPLNTQIKFRDFSDNSQRFDVIFMNDVFEHVSDPVDVLKQLASKLKPRGAIFIDTPKQFWLYSCSKIFSKKLYEKVLRGTVSKSHLQIWSQKSFDCVVQKSALTIDKYEEVSEYTMRADFYMKNMGIINPLLKLFGRLFFSNAKWLAKNKILAVLS